MLTDGNRALKVPDYQRNFSWTKEELSQFIEDKNYIQVNGLEFYNLKSTKVNETPIDIRNNYINYIETTLKNGNTHDIAIYGTSSSAKII